MTRKCRRFKRYDNSGNNGNRNNFGNAQNNQDDDRFQKFRDSLTQEHGSNTRPQYNSWDGRGRNHYNWKHDGGRQHFRRDASKGEDNRYEDRNCIGSGQSERLPIVASSSASVANPLQETSVTHPQAESPSMPPFNENDLPKGEKNIKQEKIEQTETKRVVRQQEEEVHKSKLIETKNKPGKAMEKNVNPPTSSSSSSSGSSSEEEESNKKTSSNTAEVSKKIKETVIKNLKETKKKQSSEDELIWLGNLEKKFVIKDDASDETSDEDNCNPANSQCLICDKQGHIAFKCQMICKNCSGPYHNMKSCPKPANLSIMMQSFMEFCMRQMSQFNPEQKFTLPKSMKAKENLQIGNEVQSKKVKKVRTKSKEPPKKVSKRKRKLTNRSSDEEEDEEEDETEEESESESDSSDEVTVSKTKKKRRKETSLTGTSDFPTSFVPPFSPFPGFGAAAAAYNPLLFGQFLNSGGFGARK